MADLKISQLTALNGAVAVAGDLLTVVDISDTTMSASGTNKKMTLVQFQAAPVSAGTANGVTYLNGSKVLTSGSALTFDGANLGIGASAPNAKLDVNGTVRSTSFIATDNLNTATVFKITPDGSGNTTLFNFYSGYMAFGISNTEQMRLTSTGLGIGTSSPLSRLNIQQSADGFDKGLTLSRTGANRGTIFLDASNDTLNFGRSGFTAITLDASGNLIHSAPTTPPTLATNGQMVFNLTSDTNLRVSVRGSDGVTRTANITLA